MPTSIQPGKWHLLRLKTLNKNERAGKMRVEIVFDNPAGDNFKDDFYLTERAITRFEALAHRAGCAEEIKCAEAVDTKVLAAIMGKRVWAFVIEDSKYPGQLRTDGWKFREESDPPEEEVFIDYGKKDEWETAMDGL